MEKLSQVTTRTDSGAGVRQRAGSGIEESNSRFERMFEEELTKQGSKLIEKEAETKDNGKEVKPVKDEDNTDEALAAGVMGNLQNNEVVFILEGDITSTTTPEIHVENNTAPPEPEQIVISENNEAKPEVTVETRETRETREYAQVAEAVNAEQNKPANAEIKVENNTGIFEDVMARKPDLGIQESRSDTDTSSKSFENGNPSPLENENDTAQIKGQSEKTYADTVNAVNSAINDEKITTEENQPVNDILPPLSEGIRPEQFQATQQMTQAALSAPVKPENLFQEMISRVEMMQNDTKSAMTIRLNPDFLGKVALEVSIDAAGLHVKINAEDSGVRSMINGQLTALIESLENKGIEVVEVEVIHTGINYGSFQDPREGEKEQSKQQNAFKHETSSSDGIAFYTTLPDLMEYYQETGVSSIEYRA